MDFLELARERYSERFFDSRPIEQQKLDRILEAGRLGPTACNYQPQKFYLIRRPEAMAKLKTVTNFHYNAPLMILICYDLRQVWTNPADRYYQNYNSGEQDASIAATTMMYEAEEQGIFALHLTTSVRISWNICRNRSAVLSMQTEEPGRAEESLPCSHIKS